MDARSIADALIAAERERKAIAPFTDAAPGLDAGTGYQAQRMVVQHRLDGGERIIGAKLGLTSRAKQEAMGVHEPLYGWLTSGMVLPYGEPLPLAELIHPRVEPEIAFLLGQELAPPATITSVLAATEAVFAAVEVLDSRYEDFRFRLPDVIADNASGSRIVLGPQARPVGDLCDLRLLGCVLRSRGDLVSHRRRRRRARPSGRRRGLAGQQADPGRLGPAAGCPGLVGWPDGSRANGAGSGRIRRVRRARHHRGLQLTA